MEVCDGTIVFWKGLNGYGIPVAAMDVGVLR
jgi:hypothetical protein